MTKPKIWHVRPAKIQICLGIRPVWSESSLYAQWVAKDPSFLHADSEDSDQTWRILGWLVMLFMYPDLKEHGATQAEAGIRTRCMEIKVEVVCKFVSSDPTCWKNGLKISSLVTLMTLISIFNSCPRPVFRPSTYGASYSTRETLCPLRMDVSRASAWAILNPFSIQFSTQYRIVS